jgi:hypothetical protein
MTSDQDVMDFLHQQGFTHIRRTQDGVIFAYDIEGEITLAITVLHNKKPERETLQ